MLSVFKYIITVLFFVASISASANNDLWSILSANNNYNIENYLGKGNDITVSTKSSETLKIKSTYSYEPLLLASPNPVKTLNKMNLSFSNFKENEEVKVAIYNESGDELFSNYVRIDSAGNALFQFECYVCIYRCSHFVPNTYTLIATSLKNTTSTIVVVY
jgi:hypothetical protein